MKVLYSLLFVLLLILNFGCTEENIINNINEKRTLVLISDNEQGDEGMVRITGFINKNFPDVEIQFLKSKDFDIREGAYLFDVATKSYSNDAYFVALIEPSVNSKKILTKSPSGQKMLFPDNGLATRVINSSNLQDLYFVDNPDVLGGKSVEELESTVYILESIRALLSMDEYTAVGTKVTEPVMFETNDAHIEGNKVIGEVLYVDAFGNCVTNIPSELFNMFIVGDLLRINLEDKSYSARFGLGYFSVNSGENVVFFNQRNQLELSSNLASLSSKYSVSAGTKISIEKSVLNIGLLLFNESSIVNDIVDGFISQLNELGLYENNNINIYKRSANGQQSQLGTLTNQILQNDIDIFVSVSTPASQAAVLLVPEQIPLIFTYVTDPVSAGLFNIRKNVSGLSDMTNFNDLFAFIKELLPSINELGSLYNDQESNSVYAQDMFKQVTIINNLKYIQRIMNNQQDLTNIYNAITVQNELDAMLIVADNLLSLLMEQLSQMAINSKLPLIGDSYQHCIDGALASISVDYDELAMATGDMVYTVLLGKNPDTIIYQRFPSKVIALNTETASKIDFVIPENIKQKAKFIFP